jgi:hypothetical protein
MRRHGEGYFLKMILSEPLFENFQLLPGSTFLIRENDEPAKG